ncbi:MAG: MBL fold metallo-hydrolase [Oscillospiraceae bacterium]|nr:MBL fold metallo-hydrolase [Oscillospiraceae bacterium]
MVYFAVKTLTPHVTELLGRFHERVYLVQGTEGAALIDAGSGFGSLRAAVERLTDLPLTVLLTHGHQDHAMGAVEFDEVYINPMEREVYQRHCDAAFRLQGLTISRDAVLVTPEDLLSPAPFDHFRPLASGDCFHLGGVTLETIACPGHTAGNLIFLDREEKILFSGDSFSNSTFLLGDEATSVEELRDTLLDLDKQLRGRVDRILEAHGEGELPLEILGAVARVCDQVLTGDSDRIPYDFRGYKGFTAKKRLPHSQKRVDGGLGNLLYREDKLWKPRNGAKQKEREGEP